MIFGRASKDFGREVDSVLNSSIDSTKFISNTQAKVKRVFQALKQLWLWGNTNKSEITPQQYY